MDLDYKRRHQVSLRNNETKLVLLFPLGNDGWHISILHSRGRGNVTARGFYCNCLMIRSGSNHMETVCTVHYLTQLSEIKNITIS